MGEHVGHPADAAADVEDAGIGLQPGELDEKAQELGRDFEEAGADRIDVLLARHGDGRVEQSDQDAPILIIEARRAGDRRLSGPPGVDPVEAPPDAEAAPIRIVQRGMSQA